MDTKAKEFREKIAERFIKMLESNENLSWIKSWKTSYAPFNGVSKAKYKGINAFILMMVMYERKLTDPRWYTMVQIQDVKGYCHKGQKWHLRKGSKGQMVEYWFPYDSVNKKMITWDEHKRLIQEGRDEKEFFLRSRYSYVFNAEDIEGIPEFKAYSNPEVNASEIVGKLSEKMGVPIYDDGLDRAYYSPLEDAIHLPKMDSFVSTESYNMTALHELAHSTGHSSRLNRKILNVFGSEDYAFEELVAEITAVFSSINIDTTMNIDNNLAYVQSWSKSIKDQPEFLSKAIKAAQEAAEYMDKLINFTFDIKAIDSKNTKDEEVYA